MDIARAARALAEGQALFALAAIGRIDTPAALLVRGVAYAQIGDFELAVRALRRALALGSDPLLQARARAALVELALENGDPKAAEALSVAGELLALGDVRNAAMQRLVAARAEVLEGHLDIARGIVADVTRMQLPADVRAVASLAAAEIAIRGLRAAEARAALARARRLLAAAPHALLERALEALESELVRPIARLVRRGRVVPADLFAIEDAAAGDELLVDACRLRVIAGGTVIPLVRRPVLFALLLALARSPEGIARDALVAQAFAVRRPNASHRQRLRVEIGRLRKELAGSGVEPVATADGYRLASEKPIVVLLPPTDDEGARIALLLGDGAAWTTRSLALHAGVSRSTAQRTLRALVASEAITRLGQGRDLRYVRAGPPVASRMLLLGLVPSS